VSEGDGEEPEVVRVVEVGEGVSILCLKRIACGFGRTLVVGGCTDGSILVWDHDVPSPPYLYKYIYISTLADDVLHVCMVTGQPGAQVRDAAGRRALPSVALRRTVRVPPYALAL
jgi:hypothetical protein